MPGPAIVGPLLLVSHHAPSDTVVEEVPEMQTITVLHPPQGVMPRQGGLAWNQPCRPGSGRCLIVPGDSPMVPLTERSHSL